MTTAASPASTGIVERIVAEGSLELETAAHFGDGADEATDAALLRDGKGELVIPGASIAGALRSSLSGSEVRRQGHEAPRPAAQQALIERCFGSADEVGNQSLLIVDDAYPVSDAATKTALRDGVRLDDATGTAVEQAKYDFEVIEPGVRFLLRMELSLSEPDASDAQALHGLFDAALDALERGNVSLGAKTRRGLGRVRLRDCSVRRYRFMPAQTPQERLRNVYAWLSGNGSGGARRRIGEGQVALEHVLAAQLDATFALAGPVLVRGVPDGPKQPDAVQVRANGRPVLPGTGLAGAIRHRARRIALTLARAPGTGNVDEAEIRATELIDDLFGFVLPGRKDATYPQRRQKAARLWTEEELLEGTVPQVQNRIRVDRFTGGVQDGGLFDEMPEWPKRLGEGRYRVRCRLVDPAPHELDLVLLLLKDLWTGDLPVGGGAGIGRGRLVGRNARLTVGREIFSWHSDAPVGETISFGIPDADAADVLRAGYEGALQGWICDGVEKANA